MQYKYGDNDNGQFSSEDSQKDEQYFNSKPKRKETFTTSRVNFLELLVREIPFDYRLKKYKIRKSSIEPIGFEIDDSHRFRNTASIAKNGTSTIQSLSISSRNSTMRDYLKKKQLESDLKVQFNSQFYSIDTAESAMVPLEVIEWEKDDISAHGKEDISINEFVNELVDSEWDKHVFIDPGSMPVFKRFLTLYTDDPNLIFEKIEEKKSKLKKKNAKPSITDKPLKNKYNISNDKYYAMDPKTKASLGTFGVQHSIPALKLESRFYKTNHTKEELRNFHRPSCSLQNIEYKLNPPNKVKFSGNIIKKGHELTLNDTTSFVVFEYFEDYPFFVVNPGMVSLMNVYYRKSDATDEPTVDNCISLEPEEEAPFYGFGDIKPGTYLNTLANNLFIAPISEHSTCDFICIAEGTDVLIMRPIEKLFLVGQEFPKEEVFAPHSRKLNQFCKDRLKVAAYRLFSKGKDILMQQLDQMFPYFSEGSKRKWLKEYSDCIKKGKDNVWILKDSFAIIGEEDLRKLVTPENICQYESMLSAERRLQDLGYKCLETDDENQDYDLYSPGWYLSRNFLNAANGRGLLELSSPADPSGESFSFKKIKLKKGNEPENRKIVSEQQASYKERVSSIWSKHISTITSKNVIEHVPEIKRSNFEFPSETITNFDESCLTIKRYYEENGMITFKTEKIYDQKVIKAYLKAKKVNKTEEKKPLLTCSNCGQPGHMKTNKTCPNFTGSVKSNKKRPDEKKKPSIQFQERILRLISVFSSIPFSNAFHRPVSLKKFPSYGSIIKNPIDLGTIRAKAKAFTYKSYLQFLSDLELMRDNCILYNGPVHSLTEIAENIYKQGKDYYEKNRNDFLELESQMQSNVS